MANHIRPEDPELADTLKNSLYVDDIGDSKPDDISINRLTDAADKLFKPVGMEVKGWTKTGEDPNKELSTDGVTVSIGGMSWCPKLDFMELKLPGLHFWTNSPGEAGSSNENFQWKVRRFGLLCPQEAFPKEDLQQILIGIRHTGKIYRCIGKNES